MDDAQQSIDEEEPIEQEDATPQPVAFIEVSGEDGESWFVCALCRSRAHSAFVCPLRKPKKAGDIEGTFLLYTDSDSPEGYDPNSFEFAPGGKPKIKREPKQRAAPMPAPKNPEVVTSKILIDPAIFEEKRKQMQEMRRIANVLKIRYFVLMICLQMKCGYCHQNGHLLTDCPQLAQKKQKQTMAQAQRQSRRNRTIKSDNTQNREEVEEEEDS